MRLLLATSSAQNGGAELQMARLATELGERGHDVTLMFMGDGPLAHAISSRHVTVRVFTVRTPTRSRVFFIPTKRTIADYSHVPSFLWFLNRLKADVVLTSLAQPSAFVLRMAGFVAPRSVRIARLGGATERIESRWPQSEFFDLDHRLRRALVRSDAIVVNASHLVETEVHRLGVRSVETRVIENGLDLPKNPANPMIEPPSGVAIGYLRPKKGYDVLIDAVAQTHSKVRVTVLGSGPELQSLSHRAQAAGVNHLVNFMGEATDVQPFLGEAQFAVHPSLSEGLPNAVLEEMAAGLPVIASKVGGIPQLIEDGKTGILVPPGDAGALATAIDALAADPQLRSRLGSAARKRVEEYRWDKSCDQYEALFNQLAGSTGRRNASVSRQHQLSLTEGEGDGKAVHRRGAEPRPAGWPLRERGFRTSPR